MKIYNYPDHKMLFKNVEIAGGVNYFLYKANYNGDVEFNECYQDKQDSISRPLFESDLDIIISMNGLVYVLNKVRSFNDFEPLTNITLGRNAFGIVGKKENVENITFAQPFKDAVEVRCAYEEIRYIKKENITKNKELIDKWKVFTSKGNGGAGILADNKPVAILGKAFIGKPNSVCTDSLIPIGNFQTEAEALNLQKYMTTKFLRFMAGILKVSQNIYQNVYQFVPIQNFTEKSDINWNNEISNIDKQLYEKYKFSEAEIAYIESMIKPME